MGESERLRGLGRLTGLRSRCFFKGGEGSRGLCGGDFLGGGDDVDRAFASASAGNFFLSGLRCFLGEDALPSLLGGDAFLASALHPLLGAEAVVVTGASVEEPDMA